MNFVLLALLLSAAPADWVPARWPSTDASSLQWLEETPINCLLLEPAQWNDAFLQRARVLKMAVLGVVRDSANAAALAKRGVEQKLDGFVVEGRDAAQAAEALRRTGSLVIELGPRRALAAPPDAPVIGTYQGVWPGINPETQDDTAVAGPTAAPWLDTNSGFLRYLRSRTEATIWMGNVPPEGTAYPVVRYMQAVADAALGGARWVIALDRDLQRRIEEGDARALKNWKEICDFVRFVEEHGTWRRWPSYGRLALRQEPEHGAFVSGGVLDMLAVQHLPVKPEHSSSPSADELLRVDLKAASKGSEVVSPAPGWKFPMGSPDQFAIRKADLPELEDLWRRVTEATGRRNFGIRLFNGSGMLSHPVRRPDEKRLAIAMVNYTGYQVEAITLHLLGKWSKATLRAPGREAREMVVYPTKEGSGVEVDSLGVMGVLELE